MKKIKRNTLYILNAYSQFIIIYQLKINIKNVKNNGGKLLWFSYKFINSN